MDIERKRLRRGTPQEIAIVARELSRLARREVNENFIRDIFNRLIESRLLQKIFTGRIDQINLRDLRHPRIRFEDRLERIDKAGILKRLLPKTDRQLWQDVKKNIRLTEGKFKEADISETSGRAINDLLLYKDNNVG